MMAIKDEDGKLIPSLDPECKGLDPADDCILGVICARLDKTPLAFIKWIVTVLISGLLIGLGGPFWFDMYTRLAKVLGLAKAVTRGVFRMSSKLTDSSSSKRNLT